jgi:hypothetical protein
MRLLRSMIFAASILTAAAGVAATTGPIAVEPAATKFSIGKLTAFALHDADFAAANDGSVFAVDGTTDELAKVLKAAGAPPDAIALRTTSSFSTRDWALKRTVCSCRA